MMKDWNIFRFEQEILDPNGPGGGFPRGTVGKSRMIIGANTFNKVQQKITGKRLVKDWIC